MDISGREEGGWMDIKDRGTEGGGGGWREEEREWGLDGYQGERKVRGGGGWISRRE